MDSYDDSNTMDSYLIIDSYLFKVNPVSNGPHGLEVVPHPMLQLLRKVMYPEEVLEVFGLGMEDCLSCIHTLDDGCNIAEHNSMHDGWGGGNVIKATLLTTLLHLVTFYFKFILFQPLSAH